MVGVPETTPFAAVNDNPGGNAPEDMVQVREPDPPVAAKACEYADPVRPSGKDSVVMERLPATVMEKLRVALADGVAESVTRKTKL